MKLRGYLVIATGSLIACGGGSRPTAPTAPTPAANIAGSYDVSIGASSSCSASLPVATRVLKYVANVTQTGAAFTVQLLADVMWNSATVTGTVSGQTVTFSTFSLSEITTGGGITLATTGTANVDVDGSMIGTLSGTYQAASGTNCNAANHQLHMVRR